MEHQCFFSKPHHATPWACPMPLGSYRKCGVPQRAKDEEESSETLRHPLLPVNLVDSGFGPAIIRLHFD